MILLLLLFFFTSPLDASDLDTLPTSPNDFPTRSKEVFTDFLNKIPEKSLYLGLGTSFKSISFLAQAGQTIPSFAKECLLLKTICNSVSQHFFTQMAKESPFKLSHLFSKNIPYSQTSWKLNQLDLSKIQTSSNEEQELLLFLENRFLAKATGFFPSFVDWVYPSFGISIQIHPETTGSYARSPAINFSKSYEKRITSWKKVLPHPESFPLILTRPFDLNGYLPSYFKVPLNEGVKTTVQNLALILKKTNSKVVIDFSSLFLDELMDSKKWLRTWDLYQRSFLQACKENKIDLHQILCIERVAQKTVGGLRILPLYFFSAKEVELQHQFLLGWVSTFGLSANRVELDRSPLLLNISNNAKERSFTSPSTLCKESFLHYLISCDQNWKSKHTQKSLMLTGALASLKGLLTALSEDTWEKITYSKTLLSIAELSFRKIHEQLELLSQEKDSSSFFDTVSHIEEIYSHLSALLEIFCPFSLKDFSPIYQRLLNSTPSNLKPLTSHSLHSSAMTSISGVFRAAEKTLGRSPHILYGENTYYECINASNLISNALSVQEAREDDLKEIDVFLSQFNPVWKALDPQKKEYKVEKVSETLRKTLRAREGKPLTLALDCTFDFIDSPQVSRLLHQFQEDIENGSLNVICYHSGLKFDLFGMDNYCGAPFYMIHNKDPKWIFFDFILTDPVLQTDLLSLNWFCLAYQNAAPQLDQYRKQIFDNTRALLDSLPDRILRDSNINYRVIPVEREANAAFIDITIKGPFHRLKTEALVAGYLTVKCLEKGFPLFYRISIGLYHTNLTKLCDKDSSTVRLTVGLDPSQIEVLTECLKNIDALNGTSF